MFVLESEGHHHGTSPYKALRPGQRCECPSMYLDGGLDYYRNETQTVWKSPSGDTRTNKGGKVKTQQLNPWTRKVPPFVFECGQTLRAGDQEQKKGS